MFISFTVNDIHYLSTTYTICQTIANKKEKQLHQFANHLPTIGQHLTNSISIWQRLIEFGNFNTCWRRFWQKQLDNICKYFEFGAVH